MICHWISISSVQQSNITILKFQKYNLPISSTSLLTLRLIKFKSLICWDTFAARITTWLTISKQPSNSFTTTYQTITSLKYSTSFCKRQIKIILGNCTLLRFKIWSSKLPVMETFSVIAMFNSLWLNCLLLKRALLIAKNF